MTYPNLSVDNRLPSTSEERGQKVSKMSSGRVDNNSLTWWYILKTSGRFSLKISFQDVLKTSWKWLEDVLKRYHRDEYVRLDQGVLKTSYEDLWLKSIYISWSRRLEVLRFSFKEFFRWRLHISWVKEVFCLFVSSKFVVERVPAIRSNAQITFSLNSQ